MNKCLFYWYFQQNQCINITKNVLHNIHSLAWAPMLVGHQATPQRAHALKLALGYHPVGSSWLWVSLLNKCETSNSYCRAMTRFDIKPCGKISNYFHFFCQNVFFCTLKILLAPPSAPLDVEIWVTLPLAAKIYCCLTRYSFVVMLNRPQKSFGYIVLAREDNTMAGIGLF